MAREYRRTCRRCGTVWHSLVSRETKVKADTCNNQCDQCNETCIEPCDQCGNCSSSRPRLQAKRNAQASESELQRLRTCPNCKSASYREEIL